MKLKLDGKLHPVVATNVIPGMLKNLSLTRFAPAKALKLDKYLKEQLKTDITVRRAIEIALSNLQTIKSSDGFYNVIINPNIVFPGTDIKIGKLIKFITYGNLEVDGYGLINDVFEYLYNKQYQINDVYTRKRWR